MEEVLITSKICKTSDIGVNDNLFGGVMLSWLDEAGAIHASQIIGDQNVVTVKIREVIFKKPVKVKDLILIKGRSIKIGTTSLTLKLFAYKSIFGVKPFDEELVCETVIVFVRINEEGNAIPIKSPGNLELFVN